MTQHVVELAWEEAVDLLQSERRTAHAGIERGQVALRVEGSFIGAGNVGDVCRCRLPRGNPVSYYRSSASGESGPETEVPARAPHAAKGATRSRPARLAR
jgi:hypothetical protein